MKNNEQHDLPEALKDVHVEINPSLTDLYQKLLRCEVKHYFQDFTFESPLKMISYKFSNERRYLNHLSTDGQPNIHGQEYLNPSNIERKLTENEKSDMENQEVEDDLDLLESIFMKPSPTPNVEYIPNPQINENNKTINPNINYMLHESSKETNIYPPVESNFNHPNKLNDKNDTEFNSLQITNQTTLLSMGFDADIVRAVVTKYDDINDSKVYDVLAQLQQCHHDHPKISVNRLILLLEKMEGNIIETKSWVKDLEYLMSLGFDETLSYNALVDCDGMMIAALDLLTKNNFVG